MKLIYIALLALLFSSCTTVKTQTSSLVAEAKTNKQFGTEIAKTEGGHEFNTYASTTVLGVKPYAAFAIGYAVVPKEEEPQPVSKQVTPSK
jgi:hypothetical protein